VLGEKTTINYLDELEGIRNKKNPAHFIAGLGYKNLAYKTAYSIAQQIIGVYNKDNHQGNKVESFYNGLDIMMKFIEKTSYQFMTIPKESVIKYCITGELSVSRNEMISYLSTYNWLFVNNISKNIKYLILGALPKDSTKLNRAKELGIKIISEDEIYSLLPKEIKDDCTV
jgi:NAD-dependent DNA ligase